MIAFKYERSGGELLLECGGHAGERGSSLPCAAASALMAAAMAAVDADGTAEAVTDVAEGYVRIVCKATERTRVIAEMTAAGFAWLARQSPEVTAALPEEI